MGHALERTRELFRPCVVYGHGLDLESPRREAARVLAAEVAARGFFLPNPLSVRQRLSCFPTPELQESMDIGYHAFPHISPPCSTAIDIPTSHF